MMNSTEKLQQIFKKPIKKASKLVPEVKNVTYSSEMVKDLIDLVHYPITDVRFHLKLESTHDEINALSTSLENLENEYKIKGEVYSSLNMYSSEMSRYYLKSMEGPDVKAMAKNVGQTLYTLLRKIVGYVMGLIRKVSNWVKLKLSKSHLKTYMEYLKNKTNFNWDAKVKAGKKLNPDSFKVITDALKQTNYLKDNAVIYQDTQNEKKKEYSSGIYAGRNEHLKELFSKVDNEITVKDAIGGENNIKFISKEFFNSINTLISASKTLVKDGEKLAKEIKKEDNGANMRYKNQVKMIQSHANDVSALISACITASGFVNSCIKKGLGKSANEEKPKEDKAKTEEKPAEDSK